MSQKESSEVQSLALLHLGVAQSQAADQMDLLPRKLKVQYDKEALEALQKAAQLQPDSFLCLYNLARIQVTPTQDPIEMYNALWGSVTEVHWQWRYNRREEGGMAGWLEGEGEGVIRRINC